MTSREPPAILRADKTPRQEVRPTPPVSIDHETAPWSSVKIAWQETLPCAGRADVDSRTIRDPLRGEKGPLLLCKFAQGYLCRCDEVICCEVSEAARRRKHDWVPRLSRLVEQQGERVTSRTEYMLPPANRHSDSCGIKPVALLHHVKEVLHDSRSAFFFKKQTTKP